MAGGGGGGGGGGDGGGGVVRSRYCEGECERELTVRKTSLFYPGDGFLVYEHHRPQEEQREEGVGELVFRVDMYGGGHHHNRRDELVLMGPDGSCILTIKKKKASLHQRWEGFPGPENGEDHTSNKKPIFSVRRASIIGCFGVASPTSFLVDLESSAAAGGGGEPQPREQESPSPGPSSPQYLVEGSYSQRCCTVYENDVSNDDRRAVVGIGRKVDATTNVTLGKDVFCLRLSPGFDAAFAMGIVLALDQITADEPHSPSDDEPFPPSGGGRF